MSRISGASLRQPVKGIVFTLASVPFTVAIWFLLTGLFGLEYGPATSVITVCFTWFWPLGWAFGGWPANRVTGSRWARAAVNWIVLMTLVWGSVKVWEIVYAAPFQDTPIAKWAQTAIIAGVASLFFFENTLLLPTRFADQQPLAGLTNTLFAVLFVPFALLYLPQLGGGGGWYVPWIWFPLTVVVVTFFAGWPFDQLGQPRAGFAYLGAVFFLTLVLLAVLNAVGLNFFAPGDAGTKAAIFGATWTNVALVIAWLFNNWPAGRFRQPGKGLTLTGISLILSIAIYAALIAVFGKAHLTAVLFGSFAFLWAQVSLAAPGLADVWRLGHDDDPGGAGLESTHNRDETEPGAVAPEVIDSSSPA